MSGRAACPPVRTEDLPVRNQTPRGSSDFLGHVPGLGLTSHLSARARAPGPDDLPAVCPLGLDTCLPPPWSSEHLRGRQLPFSEPRARPEEGQAGVRPVGAEETLGLSRPFGEAGHRPCLIQTWSLLSLPFPLTSVSPGPTEAAGVMRTDKSPGRPALSTGPRRGENLGQ